MSRNLYQKMTDIMKEVDTVFKGANISMGNGRSYSAVTHDDVTSLLHKPLANHGIWTKVSIEKVELTTRDKPNKYGDTSVEYRADVWVEVTFINADKPEEREVCKGFAYAFDSSDKAVGKAESMAVKYIYLKNFTLESTDNEESRDHEHSFKQPPKKDLVKEVSLNQQRSATVPPVASVAPRTPTAIVDSVAPKKTVSFKKPAPSTSVGSGDIDL